MICLAVVFTTAQGGWWLAAIPTAAALIGGLFGDEGVRFVMRVIGNM